MFCPVFDTERKKKADPWGRVGIRSAATYRNSLALLFIDSSYLRDLRLKFFLDFRVRFRFGSLVCPDCLASFNWHFRLLQAESNICQFKILAAVRNSTRTVLPGAFASRSFQTVTRSDPKTVRGIGLFGFTVDNPFGFRCHRVSFPFVRADSVRIDSIILIQSRRR